MTPIKRINGPNYGRYTGVIIVIVSVLLLPNACTWKNPKRSMGNLERGGNIDSPAGMLNKGHALLGEYDFSEGGYVIAGLNARGALWPEDVKCIGDIYADDVDVLNELKSQWIMDGVPNPGSTLCAPHYVILVMKGRTVLDEFGINLECEFVETKNGQFGFDPQTVYAFEKKFRQLEVKEKKFRSCKEGREYLKELSGKKDVLYFFKPPWTEYDGYFMISEQCDTVNAESPDPKSCLDKIKHDFRKSYARDSYRFGEVVFSEGSLTIVIHCRKQMYEEFNLYKIYEKWTGYRPELTVFLKK